MEALKIISEIREKVASIKEQGKTIGLVPTMGALHGGHLSLIREAQKRADEVVVSIYVNPKQFGPDEDFEEYPRQLDKDLELCKKEDVSVVFAPSDEMMYPGDQFLSIDIDRLNKYMDGGSRLGFFEGIVLVVNKLFNIIKPDVAVFGQKDVQQFCILRQMVAEFNHDVELVMVPIQRANDGLALSSRNQYLDEKQRQIAPGLYRSLRYVKKQIKGGAQNVELLLNHQKEELREKGFKIDYVNVFSFDEIALQHTLTQHQKYILAGAVYLGKTRLIDNLVFQI